MIKIKKDFLFAQFADCNLLHRFRCDIYYAFILLPFTLKTSTLNVKIVKARFATEKKHILL